jgi:hypothetical protein
MELNDGPVAPDKFAYGGGVYIVQSQLVWRLISHVWKKPGHRASVDSLAEGVWGNPKHDISYLALATLRRNANRFFTTNNLPFKMRAGRDGVVILDRSINKDISNG